ncbi:arsenosugar biosynthesis radical SAM protein ArsS [Flavobacteriales bacterium]|jgi:radical SAM/Cys-rich protein|nr:arsenosugar biosynthesis radical SAM protein ArsS [Flavobacteriales bacterium]MDG1175630.1 arsenosugar biosynthesis radical SAM protein ArsS [Flavobacteriales bacterium]
MSTATKSLKKQNSEFSNIDYQLKVLHHGVKDQNLDSFSTKLKETNLFPLTTTGLDIFQINMGKMCNQVCSHCHVDAGPDRKEIMSKETLQECLDAIAKSEIKTVDLTGGAPEMNPHFRWFVEQAYKLDCKVIVRCNLTIIVANKKYFDLPEFYKENEVEIVSSLPHYSEKKTDSQRGDGVFDRSIRALMMLNEVGYGMEGSGLTLNLVYNPSGAFLPPNQDGLEKQFKRKLKKDFDIEFNSLFAITNIPISRYLDYLVASENFMGYMEKLANSYNPVAAEGVMCRNTISVGWDGYLYDCDFNQMLELKVAVADKKRQHVKDFDSQTLIDRKIIVNEHCFGCTAGAGSSCGGEIA